MREKCGVCVERSGVSVWRESVCERERECVCERERESVCERERERECGLRESV